MKQKLSKCILMYMFLVAVLTMERETFIKRLVRGTMILDGSYGAQFFKMGYSDLPGEVLNLKEPAVVEKLQRAYCDAGADILLTNTFSANRLKLKTLGYDTLTEDINEAAVTIARRSAEKSNTLVFGDFSSTGEFPEPVGEAKSELIYHTFYEQAHILDDMGVDGFIIETMTDLKELKLAILAIRDVNTSKPVIAQMTFEETMRSVTGTSIAIFAGLMDDLDVDVVGVNCTVGPKKMRKLVKELAMYTGKPLSVEPNAGKPYLEDDRLVYKMGPDEFAVDAQDFVELGASIIGGCCGTGPEHISVLRTLVDKNLGFEHSDASKRAKGLSVIEKMEYLSSRTKLFTFYPFTPIGERINPASKRRFQNEIEERDFSRILTLSREQEMEGAKLLDINLGIEKILDKEHFSSVIVELDRLSSNPLSLDIQSNKYLKRALFEYVGRPLINSARVTPKSLERKATLLKRYGGMLILLAMTKRIPKTAEDRVRVIKEGVERLSELGVRKERIVADPLVLSLGANNDPGVTLQTVRMLTQIGLKTTMGLSNLSFGLPGRSGINAAFLAEAIGNGLSSAIMNTGDRVVLETMYGSLSLKGELVTKEEQPEIENPITRYLLNGNSKALEDRIKSELEKKDPIEVSQKVLGKAMEEIGELYGKGTLFLPHLLLAAETAQPEFDRLNAMSEGKKATLGKILLATVEGDVHDIGKKIVGTVLKSGGFEIVDIGKDVSADKILEAVKKHEPEIIGLSAMMTTTVARVEEVRKAIVQAGLKIPVIAGGASMNKKLSDRFGCDGYAKDATRALRLCKEMI